MSPRGRAVIARMVVVLLLSVTGFTLGHGIVRQAETAAAIALVHPLSTRVFRPSTTSIGVVPVTGRPFQAVVTPTCSSLSSVLAIVGLGSLCPRSRRRTAAVFAAAATVAAGNVVRIAASVAVGIAAGRGSLILFHDWVGSVFAFAYTLGGYILMLSVLLSRSTPDSYELELA
jgi:exosortase/archaeosortase family protein